MDVKINICLFSLRNNIFSEGRIGQLGAKKYLLLKLQSSYGTEKDEKK